MEMNGYANALILLYTPCILIFCGALIKSYQSLCALSTKYVCVCEPSSRERCLQFDVAMTCFLQNHLQFNGLHCYNQI